MQISLRYIYDARPRFISYWGRVASSITEDPYPHDYSQTLRMAILGLTMRSRFRESTCSPVCTENDPGYDRHYVCTSQGPLRGKFRRMGIGLQMPAP